MLEVLNLDFVRTARAKGLDETRVVVRHVLRNALLPMVTLIGLQAGTMLGGSVVVESVFSLPGLGRLAYESVVQRDLNTLARHRLRLGAAGHRGQLSSSTCSMRGSTRASRRGAEPWTFGQSSTSAVPPAVIGLLLLLIVVLAMALERPTGSIRAIRWRSPGGP